MKFKLFFVAVSFLAVSVLLSGCSMKGKHSEVNKSIVKLEAKSGSKVSGTLYLEDHFGGLIISGKVSGLKKGKHGFHVHETGNCSAADASSAGGHFHKEGQVHGDKGVETSHLGDLGNIEVGKDGSSDLNLYIKGLSLGKGETSIVNKALVIHADADDFKSQPAGNSGARIACGVIEVKACDDCGDAKEGDCPSKKGGCKDCKKGK